LWPVDLGAADVPNGAEAADRRPDFTLSGGCVGRMLYGAPGRCGSYSGWGGALLPEVTEVSEVSSMAEHPDLSEVKQAHDLQDGLYLALSSWIVGFAGPLMMNNAMMPSHFRHL